MPLKSLDTYPNADMPEKAAKRLELAQQKILADLVEKTPVPSWANGLEPMLYRGGVGYTNPKTGSAYDPAGNLVYEVPKIRSGMDDLPLILAIASLPFAGPALFEALGLTGAGGAGLLADTAALTAGNVAAATPLAFTPEMIAAGAFTPGSIGAAGATAGLLAPEALAAAYGTSGLLSELTPLVSIPEVVTQTIPEAVTQTIPEVITQTIPEAVTQTIPEVITPSINEMVASGAFTPGSVGATGAVSGALTGAELAAAYGVPGLLSELAPLASIPEAVTQTIPEVIAETVPQTVAPSINEMVASGTFTPGSAGAVGASQGLLNAAQLAATYGTGGSLLSDLALAPTATPGTPPPPNLEAAIPSGPSPTPTPPPPPQLTPAAIESGLGTPGYGVNASAVESGLFNPELIGSGAYLPFEGVTPTAAPPVEPSKLPSWVNPTNALLAASAVSSIAKANETAPTAPTFTMAPYVPPSGKPFANLGMSPIATPYTPTRILGQYDPTMTPGGVSPYELIMAQMQAPKNLYADFEAGTNIGGFDPQRFVVPPAAAAAALPNNMGGMIDKSRMVGPNPMGPDNGFASIQDGEFVMNRKATQKYGIELMNAINSGKISKGKLSGLLEA